VGWGGGAGHFGVCESETVSACQRLKAPSRAAKAGESPTGLQGQVSNVELSVQVKALFATHPQALPVTS
jgi:hypothetical protein